MRTVRLVAILIAALPSPGAAQTPARPATLDDVLLELRSLRTDMLELQAASVRAQLLAARLQVEEQRIAGLARDLAETEEQIRGLDAARNPFTDMMLKELSKAPAKPEDADMTSALKAQLEKLQNGDPALKDRQASLTQMLGEEQARWGAFNAQLEALERELPGLMKKK
jgi:chromosome segregation ATPase